MRRRSARCGRWRRSSASWSCRRVDEAADEIAFVQARARCPRPLRRSGTIRSCIAASSATCARRAASAASIVTASNATLAPTGKPRQRRQVGRNHGRDLGIAAGGLPVGQQHDRRAVARHLDRARRDGIGRDVEAAAVLERPAGEAHAHAVGARPDGVFAVEEGRDLAVREVIVLGTLDDADARPRRTEREAFEADLVALARLAPAAAADDRPPRARGPASRRCRRGYRSTRCPAPARCRSRPRPRHRAPSRR